MLTFDVKTSPPTQAQIDQERTRLYAEETVLKRKICVIVTLVTILAAGLLTVGYAQGWFSGQAAFIVAVVVVVAVVVAGVGVGIIAVVVAGIIGGFVAGVVAGVVAVAVAGVGVVAVASVVAIADNKDKLSAIQKRRDALTPVPEESDLCVQIVKICCKHPECDDYQITVAEQGRSLVIAEAEMITTWDSTADQRAKEAKALRERQVAWRLLRAGERMHSTKTNP